MYLQADAVRSMLDDLAVEIEQTFGQEQVVSGTQMIAELESLRKMIETSAPNLIAAYYGYLRIKEDFEQLKARTVWAKVHFWRLFVWQLSMMVLLFLLAGIYGWAVMTGRLHLTTSFLSLSFACMWWGAVGATLSALHLLYHNRLEGTLSQSMEAWLYTKQLSGGVLGLAAGLLLQLTGATMNGHLISSSLLPSLSAFLAGFSERRFLNYLQQKVGGIRHMGKPVSPPGTVPSPSQSNDTIAR